jgi:hypothetical protein
MLMLKPACEIVKHSLANGIMLAVARRSTDAGLNGSNVP